MSQAKTQPLHTKAAIFALMVALGLLGNQASLTLFHGLDFFFGSIITLFAVQLLGAPAGFVIAILSSSYSVVKWGHPYALIIQLVEVVFVGLLWRRRGFNLLTAAAGYWLVLGVPLVFLFYGLILKTNWDSLVLIAFKQGVNGILNALIAALIHWALLLRRTRESRQATVPLREACFTLFSAIVLLPSLFLTLAFGKSTVSKIESDLLNHLNGTGSSIETYVRSWQDKHLASVQNLAKRASDLGLGTGAALQSDVMLLKDSFPELRTVLVADSSGTTLAEAPVRSEGRQPLVGLNFSSADAYQTMKNTHTATFSEVEVNGPEGRESLIVFSAPIIDSGLFKGYVSALVELSQLETSLSNLVDSPGFKASLLDSTGHVVVSSEDRRIAEDRLNAQRESGELSWMDPRVFRWRPELTGRTLLKAWEQSYFGLNVPLPSSPGWRLIVEEPFAQHQHFIQHQYKNAFVWMFGLCFAALISSFYLSRGFVRSIARLNQVTADLGHPEIVYSQDSWPRSMIRELDTLGSNFWKAREALWQRFEENKRTTSELMRARQLAEDSNQAKSQFLANMSHEIRTPLGAILGSAELMMSENSVDPEECLAAIRRNGVQLGQLIDEILDLSKIEANRIDFERKEVTLSELIHNGIFLLRHQAKEKGLELEIEIEGPVPRCIHSDATRIKQILTNIIGNAIKFTASGRILVTLSLIRSLDGTGLLRFQVLDSGIGIAADNQQRLFQPFMQADSSTTRRYGGTGLGLVLAKKLAKVLGGDVRIAWSEPGEGSLFDITIAAGSLDDIPMIRNLSEVPPPRPVTCEAYEVDFSAYQILVVDDAPDNRWLLEKILQRAGARVVLAENGLEALDRVKENRLDLILMDIQMPELDGYETLRRLRSSGSKLPIIALTAHAMKEERERILDAGFDDHVVKPINRAALLQSIATHIRRSLPHQAVQPPPSGGEKVHGSPQNLV